MINIKKTEKNFPELEVEKNKPNGTYRLPSVVDQLDKDFFGKCYLCEYKVVDANIEHITPHKSDDTLKFDWKNLFLACSHCNEIKSSTFNNIMNCTKEDVEAVLEYEVDHLPKVAIKVKTTVETASATQTVALLNKIYNASKPPLSKLDAYYRRELFQKQFGNFINALFKYSDIVDQENKSITISSTEKQTIENEVKKFLLPTEIFSGILRYYISRQSDVMFNIFKQYIQTIKHSPS